MDQNEMRELFLMAYNIVNTLSDKYEEIHPSMAVDMETEIYHALLRARGYQGELK